MIDGTSLVERVRRMSTQTKAGTISNCATLSRWLSATRKQDENDSSGGHEQQRKVRGGAKRQETKR